MDAKKAQHLLDLEDTCLGQDPITCSVCTELLPVSSYYQHNLHTCKGCLRTKAKVWRCSSMDAYKKAMVQQAKARARKNGLEFSITTDNVTIPTHCPVLPYIELRYDVGDTASSPSLDRIDPYKGYTPDNTRVISTRANLLKNNATLQELKYLYEDALKLSSPRYARYKEYSDWTPEELKVGF